MFSVKKTIEFCYCFSVIGIGVTDFKELLFYGVRAVA